AAAALAELARAYVLVTTGPIADDAAAAAGLTPQSRLIRVANDSTIAPCSDSVPAGTLEDDGRGDRRPLARDQEHGAAPARPELTAAQAGRSANPSPTASPPAATR
ncbi:MAG TPA: hypothetical protein VGE95_21040, partial [Arthrobacter sp.]